jgi:hypothetical protein
MNNLTQFIQDNIQTILAGILVFMFVIHFIFDIVISKSRYKYIKFVIEYIIICILYTISNRIYDNDIMSSILGSIIIYTSIYCAICILHIYRDLSYIYIMMDKVKEQNKSEKENKNGKS